MTRANADAAELDKFDALASRWWDPDGEFKPLHRMNPLRLDYIEQHAGGLKGKAVADIGCGGGLLSEGMARRGARVTGIDLAESPLAVARLHALESGVEVDYRHQSAEELAAAEAASYDVVTCLEMLEHVPDPAAVVAACSQLLRPGGSVVFSTLNRTPKAWLMGVVGAEYVLRLLPRGTHDYAKFIRPSELESWARAEALEAKHATGMHYNPLLGEFRLGAGLDVNYIMHFVKTADA